MNQLSHNTAKVAPTLVTGYEASAQVSEADERVVDAILTAISLDSVDSLEAAISQLPALNLNLFSIRVVDEDAPEVEPISLLRLAQLLDARKVSAFIIGEGLPVNNAECLTAMGEWMDEAAAAQVDAQYLHTQETALIESLRPESFEDVNNLLNFAFDIEASLGEPCQLRAMCKELCREYMQSNGYGPFVNLDNFGGTMH